MIVGSLGNDSIAGLGGNDRICGLGGDDFISGGLGNDRVNAGPGTDRAGGDFGTVDTFAGTNPNFALDGGDDLLILARETTGPQVTTSALRRARSQATAGKTR